MEWCYILQNVPILGDKSLAVFHAKLSPVKGGSFFVGTYLIRGEADDFIGTTE